MKNQECYNKEGKLLGWFSRSVAVVAIVVVEDKGKRYVLASQRGKGTPDKELVGKWNLCCGYLDFDETGVQAAIRETFEETGVDLKGEEMTLLSVNTNPKTDKHQNVTLRYGTLLKGDKSKYEKQFSHKHNEKDEVGDIMFIEEDKLTDYDWAFNHKELIEKNIDRITTKKD